MTDDQEYAARLRAQVDTLVPTFDVDTASILPRARRRRRAAAWTSGTAALAVVLVTSGWAVQSQPWDTATPPAGAGAPFVPVEGPMPTPTVDPGWPDAPFWYSLSETESEYVGGPDDGKSIVERNESWSGHGQPGLLMTNGDVTTAMGIGPALWGDVLIDGERVLVDWDTLYTLTTDPVELEQLLRNSLEADRGSGTDDDKVYDAARGLLANSPAPPTLRVALMEVVSGLPGTTVTPGVTDSAGRPGTLVERLDAFAVINRLVFEPGTGRLLEQSTTMENPPPPEPGVYFTSFWRATYLEEGPADDTPVEPTLENSGCATLEGC